MGWLLAGHLLFRLFNQAFHHIAAHIAVFPAGKIAVVALLEIDAQFPGNFEFHVVQGGSCFGHGGLIAPAGVLVCHSFFHLLAWVHGYFDPAAAKYAVNSSLPIEIFQWNACTENAKLIY